MTLMLMLRKEVSKLFNLFYVVHLCQLKEFCLFFFVCSFYIWTSTKHIGTAKLLLQNSNLQQFCFPWQLEKVLAPLSLPSLSTWYNVLTCRVWWCFPEQWSRRSNIYYWDYQEYKKVYWACNSQGSFWYLLWTSALSTGGWMYQLQNEVRCSKVMIQL